MDAIDDEAIQRLCTGVNVFFCCLGTTKKAAGSAVSMIKLLCLFYLTHNYKHVENTVYVM